LQAKGISANHRAFEKRGFVARYLSRLAVEPECRGERQKFALIGRSRYSRTNMNHSRFLTALCAAVLPFALALAVQGCKNDEDATPPVPSAAPTPTPTPSAAPPVVLKTEDDAGVDAADDAADASDAAKVTGTGDPTGIRKCCAALRQNANSAPLDQKGSLLSAAAMCDGLVNSPQGKQALVAVRGLLKGASMPASCQ